MADEKELSGLAKLWNNIKNSTVGQYAKAHPAMTGALGLSGAGNIAGLFDNNQVGGQLIGAGLGGLAGNYVLPKLLGTISPQAKVLSAMIGGNIGSMADSLIAKKNEEAEYQKQMALAQAQRSRY